jgi:predicted DsbA family dithiol-disulfide isomerase
VLAGRHGRADDALHALFRGHFRDGADVSDLAQAAAIVSTVVPELEPDALCAAIDEGEGDAEVSAEEGLAARMGITGVPFFLAARSVALSGAHEPDTLRELIAAGRQRVEADTAA